MNRENRKFSRVETRMRAYARRVDSPKVKPIYSCSPTQAPMPDRIPGAPDSFVQFLKTLDNKLDTIISFLNKHNIETDFPLQLEVIEISGAGIKFISEETFKLNEAIELALILNRNPQKIAGMVCTLIRQEKIQKKTIWLASFTSIRDNDREAIVQYVFHEQRESIRRDRSS